jgi:hypothetical protein
LMISNRMDTPCFALPTSPPFDLANTKSIGVTCSEVKGY